MRYFSFLTLSFLFLGFAACKTAQKTSYEKKVLKIDSTKNSSGKIYFFKNKKLEVTETNGSLAYTMIDNPNSSVVQFSYEKDMDKVAYDGGYREEVVFELPNDGSAQNYTDNELQNTKMLFGRYCFCRGKTGLYKVREGKLHFDLSGKEPHFELQFKIIEVPQITKEISY